MVKKFKKKKGGTKKKKTNQYDNKIVKDCIDCKIELPKFNQHHLRCDKCWNKYQLSKGNLLILNRD